MHTNRGTGTETNVPRTSLPCPPRYGNSTRRWFAEALGANHPLVYYRSERWKHRPAASATTTFFIPYYLTIETGTMIHPNIIINLFNYVLKCFCFVFFWCPCMAINNVSVQHDGGFLPGIIPLIQCYYHWGTRLNAMKGFVFAAYDPT